MQLSYANDKNRGAGYGVLTCSGEAFSAPEYTIALQRASDHQYLNNDGRWGQQAYLACVGQERAADGELKLFIGPKIVNYLDPQDGYRVFLRAENGESFVGQLRVSDVRYSPAGTVDNTASLPPEKPEKEPSPAAPAPEKPQEETPEPVEGNAPEEAPAEASALDEGEVGLAPREQQEEAVAQLQSGLDAQAAKKTRLPLFIILALVLLAALAGAWYFFAYAPEEAGAPVRSEPEKPAAPSPQAGTEEQVRLFFNSQEVTPREAAALARTLPATTRAEQDAIYRLYYFASENGESSVLLEYGACLDPAKPQWGSINKDAPAAWNIYERLRQAGQHAAQGAAAQDALRAWLKSEAAAGNAQARHWLGQLPRE